MPPRIDLDKVPPRWEADAFAPRLGAVSDSKIDLGAPPPKIDPPAALKLGEPRAAASPWAPPSEPGPSALPPGKLELSRPPDKPSTTEPDWTEEKWEPEPESSYLDSPEVRPLYDEDEEVAEIDSWSKVLPPSTPRREREQSPPPRRRRAEDRSYTDHLDDDEALPARKRRGFPVLGCFLFLMLLGSLAVGGALHLYGHEIVDWLDVRGYGQYFPNWLRPYLP